MRDTMRRLYNAVDVLFDTSAISRETRYTRSDGESNHPKTALQAFKSVQPFALDLDRQARLKMIVSQQGVRADGSSTHWEFFFDLTRRRAQLVCDWLLSWEKTKDDFGPVRIEIVVKPFPAAGSPIRQAVKEGKLPHRQMISMWKQECRRRPDLPGKFHDTDIVIADFLRQGLDVAQEEFSLCTGLSSRGRLSWIAQMRAATYYCDFV